MISSWSDVHSPDAGDNTELAADVHDLDGDGNMLEVLPLDQNGNLRRINDPATPDTGNPGIYSAIVDIGALEFADFKPVFADITYDGLVDVLDLLALISAWGACAEGDCPADLAPPGGDATVNSEDLMILLLNWS